MYLELALLLSIISAILSILICCHIVRRVKKQVTEMAAILTEIKSGNGNRRILAERHEIVAPLAYEINEIIVSYESRIVAMSFCEPRS